MRGSGLPGVVEDDSQGEALATHDRADSVPECRPVVAAGTRHRSVVRGEYDGMPVWNRDGRSAGLHARPLLDEQVFATGEIDARTAQGDRELEREVHRPVEILMQGVPAADLVADDEWSRLALSSVGALIEECGQLVGIRRLAEALLPAVRKLP